ncbi:cyclase family protein [Clostridium lundense]|uniref:cyclase family protein n=1 Tax=Clostridium lundense TaxID=319475 RepID=UPI00048187E4|nr:cyclase family protein [Clostridium lundense]
MKYIDLSHCIENNMISFCEEEIPHIYGLSSIKKDGYDVKKLIITTHTSTHVDAPKHIFEHGKSIDQISLDTFSGKALTIDCTKVDSCIDLDILNSYSLDNIDFILFYTGYDKVWNSIEFLKNYKYPSSKLCEYLCKSHIKGIGVDTISIDDENNHHLPNHHILLEKEKLVIENLNNLHYILNKKVDLFIFPLKISSGDGSPVRAIAKIL